jgi:ABC-type transport system involved in multi-copper enzyme maturation permease subunit
MGALKTLLRLTRVELLKFQSKPVAWMALITLFVFPIGGEVLLASVSQRDAVFPRVAYFLLNNEVLLIVALTTIVVSVMTLGNDYELGTVRVILSRGVSRYQFILSKVLATVFAAFVNGSAYISGTLLATVVAHVALSDVPLAEAAGANLVWRALGALGVICLTGFAFAGVVMLGLVIGRSSWMGMLAGVGSFMVDFYYGSLSTADTDVHRYTVIYHARSLLERWFASDPTLSLAGALTVHGLAEPGRALAILLLYGCGLTLAAILILRRQDLMTKS